MVTALALSFRQLGDRRILLVLAKSVALTLALFTILGIAIWQGSEQAMATWLGWRSTDAAAAIALFVTVLALWLLFRAVAIPMVGLFADDVVEAVEAKHYPTALAGARPVGLARSAAMGLRSALRVVAVNLLMLPVYAALLVTGVGTAAAFLAVNGWLMGRDLGDMVASRHLPPASMRAWRTATRVWRFALGLAVTALFMVPVLNILAPVLGAAMATHAYHRGRRNEGGHG